MTASIWIDDGLVASQDRGKCLQYRDQVQSDLRQAGWKWNEKSEWNVRQTGEYLGLFIDTVRFMFTVPPAKIDKLNPNQRGLLRG